MLRDMLHDLELEADCAEVIDRFPEVVNMVNNRKQNFPSQIKMGTKALEKGKKSKNCCQPKQLFFHAPLTSY